ncbi:hypothetical protein B0H14DRAFT_2649544 [Mycena olivaceomarginata]|nr:hypothetical protein B0H14DRAFT_2649544 [Mycena olivaceomarginata]
MINLDSACTMEDWCRIRRGERRGASGGSPSAKSEEVWRDNLTGGGPEKLTRVLAKPGCLSMKKEHIGGQQATESVRSFGIIVEDRSRFNLSPVPTLLVGTFKDKDRLKRCVFAAFNFQEEVECIALKHYPAP